MSYEAGGVDFDLTGLGVIAIVASVGMLAAVAISDSQKLDRSGSNQPNNRLGSGPEVR